MDNGTIALIIIGVLVGSVVIIAILGAIIAAFLNSSGGNPFR